MERMTEGDGDLFSSIVIGSTPVATAVGSAPKNSLTQAQRRREYYTKNRELLLAKSREYHAKNREREVAQIREYRAKHPDHYKEYYAKNREHISAKHKEWRVKNREHRLAKAKGHYAKNREHILARCKRYNTKLKYEGLSYYCGGIPHCMSPNCEVPGGAKDIRALTIDHIGGGGTRHRRELGSSGGGNFYRWLKKNGYPDGYQVLCMSCQFIKQEEKGERANKYI